MKKSCSFVICILFLFYQQNIFANATIVQDENNASPFQQSTDTNWVQQFRSFKAAVATHDIKKVASFFKLPITSETNELWYLISQGNNDDREKRSDTVRHFTKEDLGKYYNKLFPKKFATALSKLRIDELKRKGESETIKFKDGLAATYRMIATVDTVQQTLTLSLTFKSVEKNKKGIVESAEEYGILYLFSIKEGQLTFIKIMMTA